MPTWSAYSQIPLHQFVDALGVSSSATSFHHCSSPCALHVGSRLSSFLSHADNNSSDIHTERSSTRESLPSGLCGMDSSELPPIYVIHLPERTDRMDFLKEETAKPILDRLIFRPGINLRSLSWTELRDVFKAKEWNPPPSSANLANLLDSNLRERILHRALGYREAELQQVCLDPSFAEKQYAYNKEWFTHPTNLSRLGCALSHHNLWNDIAKSSKGPGWAIVLEDDSTFSSTSDFCKLVKDVSNLPQGKNGKTTWDFLHLRPSYYSRTASEDLPATVPSHGAFKRLRSSMGLWSYALTREFAQDLARANLSRALIDSDDFTTYACDPQSHPMHEAYDAFFPDLQKAGQRVCLGYKNSIIHHATGNAEQSDLGRPEKPGIHQKSEAAEADEIAWLREELGTDLMYRNIWASPSPQKQLVQTAQA